MVSFSGGSIFCLLCIVLIATNAHDLTVANCSREVSRRVLNFINTDFITRLGLRDTSKLKPSCPFAPSRSIFANHELNKAELRPHDWKCGYCQKRFVSEYYLDLHMHRHHSEFTNLGEDAVCLADYCGMVNCDAYPESSSLHFDETENSNADEYDDEDSHPMSRFGSHSLDPRAKAFGKMIKCSNRKIQQWREQCDTLVDLCFSADTSEEQHSRWVLQQELCQNIQCLRGIAVTGFRDTRSEPLPSPSSNNNKKNSVDNDNNNKNSQRSNNNKKKSSVFPASPVWQTIWLAIRLVTAIALVVMVVIHVMFSQSSLTDLIWQALFPDSSHRNNKKTKNNTNSEFDDVLSAFQQHPRRQANNQNSASSSAYDVWWFFKTIGQAFQQGIAELKLSFNRKKRA